LNNPTPLSFFPDNRDTPSMTPVSMTLRLQYEALSQRVFYKVRSRLRASKQQRVQSRSMHLYPSLRLVEPPIGRSELETLCSSIKIYNFVLLLFSIFWIDLTLQQKVTPTTLHSHEKKCNYNLSAAELSVLSFWLVLRFYFFWAPNSGSTWQNPTLICRTLWDSHQVSFHFPE